MWKLRSISCTQSCPCPAVPATRFRFSLRLQMQETPLRKEIDCFLPARGHIPVISASPCQQ
ncbi:MAG: hypothetical protein BHW66_00755 [Akkermansia sp. 54_46]|nr:MAG: hypothetical protein BHW66_00755 [Akkermansia sp. 54_46]